MAAMRRLALLGVAETAAANMPTLGALPRTETDIRAAVGRLGNPAQRLADRLFWFHLINLVRLYEGCNDDLKREWFLVIEMRL
jgi:hypothetical protein